MADKNNFQFYKEDFHRETSFTANENLEMYIAYYSARCADIASQHLQQIGSDIALIKKNINQNNQDQMNQLGDIGVILHRISDRPYGK